MVVIVLEQALDVQLVPIVVRALLLLVTASENQSHRGTLKRIASENAQPLKMHLVVAL